MTKDNSLATQMIGRNGGNGDDQPIVPPPSTMTTYEPRPFLYSATNRPLSRQIGYMSRYVYLDR